MSKTSCLAPATTRFWDHQSNVFQNQYANTVQ